MVGMKTSIHCGSPGPSLKAAALDDNFYQFFKTIWRIWFYLQEELYWHYTVTHKLRFPLFSVCFPCCLLFYYTFWTFLVIILSWFDLFQIRYSSKRYNTNYKYLYLKYKHCIFICPRWSFSTLTRLQHIKWIIVSSCYLPNTCQLWWKKQMSKLC